ncbi:MAG: NlpC/P60 family protein [Lachnospiraceae bacterium]|nr:NlpC/P60 family protein [Lachnospiraceae bacterium]
MSSNSFFKRIALLAIMALIVVASPGGIRAFATISELEQEKEELEKKKKEAEEQKKNEQSSLDAANEKADSISEDMEGVEEEIEEVDEALVETIASIDMINEDIKSMEEKIAITTAEYEEAKATEEAQYNAMKLRIKYLYEKGDYTYLQVLMASRDFSDMINKIEYIEKLYEYDRRLLGEYQEAKEKTLEIKNQLEEEMEELKTTEDELKEEKAYLDQIMAEKKAAYDNYQQMYNKAKKEAEAFKSRVNKINSDIRNLEKQSAAKQKEIDKAKKEEEERQKALEEERRRQEQEANNSSSSNSSSGGGNKSYQSASNYSSGGVGDRMVQYALQFVGNPYVYGGTSLTNGADCSGFVWRIYKDFGYSIPRTGMRSIGTEVSYEQARAGDIVCYPGHVALYMGNGKIVHASTAKTGIKVSNVSYRQWLTIRRVV